MTPITHDRGTLASREAEIRSWAEANVSAADIAQRVGVTPAAIRWFCAPRGIALVRVNAAQQAWESRQQRLRNSQPRQSTSAERWSPVADYEGLYEVSDQGRVGRVGGCILKASTTGRYPSVTLSKGNQVVRRSVHRLVAAAFCVRAHGADQVNHKNGNKRDSSAANLEWCTASENNLHAFRTGLNVPRRRKVRTC